MKACVIFISLLVACSANRLGGRQAHAHGHHQQHQGQRRANHQTGRRSGRDGDHPQDESANEIRAASDGYLPAAADYDYETAATDEGYGAPAGAASNIEPSYNARAGYGAPEEAASNNARAGYGAPEEAASNIDPSYNARAGYGAPEEAASNARAGYGAPEEAASNARAGYGAPEEAAATYGDTPTVVSARTAEYDYDAPGDYDDGQGIQGSASESSGSEGPRQCPGGSMEDCMEVCPGLTIRAYGACVQECADRCP